MICVREWLLRTAIAMATATQPYTFLLCLMRHEYGLLLWSQYSSFRFVFKCSQHIFRTKTMCFTSYSVSMTANYLTCVSVWIGALLFPQHPSFVIRHRRTMRIWKQIQSATLETFAAKHFRRITIRNSNSNSKHITNIHFAQKTICNYIYIEGRQLLLNCIVIAIILRGQINRKPFTYPYHFSKINLKFHPIFLKI